MTTRRKPTDPASSRIPGPFLVNRSFNDFEEFSDGVPEWQVETSLLDSGGFKANLLQLIDPVSGFHVMRTRMDARIHQVCGPPPGLRTLCIPADPALQMDWRRQQVGGNDLMIVPDKGELEGTIRPGFDMFLLSIPETFLRRQLQAVLGPDADRWPSMAEVFRCDPKIMNRLRRSLVVYSKQIASGLANPHAAARFEDIAVNMVKAMAASVGSRRIAGRSRRLDAAREATAYLEQHAHENPSIGHLCRLTAVSDRTLATGFRELYGVTPKRYIKAMRLNGVRNALRNADSETTVIADVANDWGFWHMGQLAADYRRIFGVLPSATLAGAET